ncbi:3b926ffd-fbf9-45f1-aeb5-ce2e487196cd-CDS [Sclerotinia trifoliorum]|uniref:3b926ffd-fbf9-45f1-aeb5-ce2e487196cd-CDS n=1 Tax=Sclerotinia trifoliorum TaxID=28548 RepID=A0A8H2W5S3_9HELO|nr:3b926ffd-fbf9-45f1-aeb5-ce2e487196cd-CDS [Sclerotinia trifoliorum]
MMTSERQWKRDLEKDKAKLAELNEQYEKNETLLLGNRYRSKKSSRISPMRNMQALGDGKLLSIAAKNSTLLEPAEFKALEHGKRRSIKIGPKTSAQEVKKALAMHGGSRHNEIKKREIAEWKRNQEEFGACMVDILRKENRILGFSSSEKQFDSCFDESACHPRAALEHVFYHTSSRRPSSDKRLENENSQLLEQLSTVKRQLEDLTEDYRSLEYEKFKLVQDNSEISDSLKSTQYLIKQIAENRDEHVLTNRRYAGETKARSCAGVCTGADENAAMVEPGLDIDFHAPGIGTSASNSYGGNVRADAALLIINSSHRAKFEKTFQTIYSVALDDLKLGCNDKFAPQSKVTEIANLRGTMAHLGCFTQHTPDKDADDRFLTLAEYCESEFECAIQRSSTALQAAKAFSNDS